MARSSRSTAACDGVAGGVSPALGGLKSGYAQGLAACVRVAYQDEWRGARLRGCLGCLFLYVVLLGAAVLVMGQAESGGPAPAARSGRRLFTLMALVDTAVVMGLAPLVALRAFTDEQGRHGLLALGASPVRSLAVVLSRLALPGLLLLGVVAVATLPAVGLMVTLGGVSTIEILVTRGLLLMVALGLLSLGGCCSALWGEVYAAAGAAYLVVVGLGGGVLFAAPLLSRLASAGGFIYSLLVVNPFIAMATALGLDVLRTERLYVLSPIGQRQFVYPDWETTGLGYLLLALVLLGVTVARVASRRRHLDC